MSPLDHERSAEVLEAQQLATIVGAAEDAIFSKDLRGTILSWNPAAARIYGFSAAEAVGHPVQMLLPPDRPEEVTRILARLAAGEHVDHFETRRLCKDGSVIDVSLTISPLLDAEGTVVGAATIARDITRQKETDRRIRELAAIVENSHDAIVTRDHERVVVTWNDAAERLFGYTRDEAVGQPIVLMELERDDLRPPHVDEALRRAEQGEEVAPFEVTFRAKDGTLIPASVALSPVYGEENSLFGVAGVIRDLRETRRLEEQLRQSQKLEAIGSLAGGIAHDFNNLLTVICAASDVALADVDDPRVRERIEQIDSAARLAAALTAQLLAFSRQQVLRPESLDLNDTVISTVQLLDRLIGDRVSISTELASDLWPVHVDRTQVQQVIMNLSVNARDAMPDGGSLIVRTQNVTLDETYVATHFEVVPGPHVLLEITDSGSGMDEATKRRVFDPFFTTKEAGTGLGLATVYGIVRQSSGQIFVYSEPGQGTSFKLFFPRAPEGLAATAAPAPPETSHASRARGGTILLVEDNALIRNLVTDVLVEAGYEVLAAEQGEEALAIAERASSIDLVLTDIVMPRMDGRELAEHLLARDPAMRIVFTSGYPASAGIRKDIDTRGVSFIQKPYGAHDLLACIDAALARPSPG